MFTTPILYLMKILLITLSILILPSFRNCFVSGEKQDTPTHSDSTITISISVVGDIMCHAPQFEYSRVGTDSFDFNPVFRLVSENLSKSDFTFGNLETVFAGKKAKYTGYPRFNSPSQLADALKNAGFDLLTTSNNHSLDRGEEGIKRTIAELNKRNINYNGTYVDQKDRDSIRMFNIKGVTIAFLAYSYGTNGNPIPKDKSYLINLIDYESIQRDIQAAKSKNPDIVLVHYHFGDEYKSEPSNYQKEVVDKTIEMGADIIIGGHPHVLQPIQFIKSNNSIFDSVFVAYSLGNFVSNQQKRYSDAGGVLTLHISKNIYDKSVRISAVGFVPTWVFKGNTGSKKEYVIVPSIASINDSSISFLKKNHLNKINESISDTKEILSKYFSSISFK
jgi:poly-gamma-glutamate capsule biosynthesis protein CapA/YwtB (metallophosphatase superfamily)